MAQTYRGETHLTSRELGRAGQPSLSAHDLLDDDHNRVLQLFNEYATVRFTASSAEKWKIAREIVRELKIHTAIEEEIYYPYVREKTDIDDRVDLAEAEHEAAKELIAQIETASTQDETFDEKVRELDDAIRLHISDERDAMFDTVESLGLNTPELARRLYARKLELAEELRPS